MRAGNGLFGGSPGVGWSCLPCGHPCYVDIPMPHGCPYTTWVSLPHGRLCHALQGSGCMLGALDLEMIQYEHWGPRLPPPCSHLLAMEKSS